MTADMDIAIKKKNNNNNNSSSSSAHHYDTLLLASQEEEVKSSSAAALLFENNHECHANTTRPSFKINQQRHVRGVQSSIHPHHVQHHHDLNNDVISTRKRNGEEQGCLNNDDDDDNRQRVKKQYREPLLQEPRQDDFHNKDSEQTHHVNYQDHDDEDEYCSPTIDSDIIMDKSYQEERETLPVKNVEEQQNTDPDHSSPSPHHSSSSQQDDQEDDPDWDVIARTSPASEYVPIFLAARDRRNEAEARFEMALDVAHSNLKDLIDSLCGVAADVINGRRLRLDELEVDIKHDFVDNETKRDHMSKKLVQFAANAQAQFNELMNRLVNKPNGNDFVCE